jgi:hypothetical protein
VEITVVGDPTALAAVAQGSPAVSASRSYYGSEGASVTPVVALSRTDR